MEEIRDGFTNMSLGMNALKDPFLLPEAQCARAINVTFRGGLPRTRPAFVQDEVNLPEGEEFQGAGVWHLPDGDVIVFVQDGTVYTLRLVNLKLTRYGKRFSTGTRCCFCQLEQYMVIMDGEQLPVVLESRSNVIKRRPVDNTELGHPPGGDDVTLYQSIPRATLGIFAHGRLHLVPRMIPSTEESGRSSIVSGDIMEPFYPHKVLRFSETEYLSEGGAHSLPFSMGNVGALGVQRNAATGTGLGQVAVFAEDGVCGFDFSIPRAQWKQQPLSQVLFFKSGSVSPWSLVSLNDDLVYRARDGIRTIRYTSAQAASSSGSLANIPMSNEVNDFINEDIPYLPRVSASLWDNRVLMTCGGKLDEGELDIIFKGLIAWDTAAGYYSGAQGTGAYDGLWTGLDVAQVLTARERGTGKPIAYVLTTDMALFHLDKGTLYDKTPAQQSPIESRIETKVFPLGDVGTTKQLRWVELWVKDVAMTTTIRIWYRPSGYPLWMRLGDPRIVKVAQAGHPHLRRRLRFALEETDCSCDTPTGVPLWVGTGFQLALEWSGSLVVERCQLAALPMREAPPSPCDEEFSAIMEGECEGELLDDYSYKADFEFIYKYGLEGGLWDLSSAEEQDNPDPDDLVPPVPPNDEPGFPDVPRIPNPPPLPKPGVGPGAGGGNAGDDPEEEGSGFTFPGMSYETPKFPGLEGLSLRTLPAQLVGNDRVILRGGITGLKDMQLAIGYFRYQATGAPRWGRTQMVALRTNMPQELLYERGLQGLTPNTEYRYQAWASVVGVLEAELKGGVVTFRTPPSDKFVVQSVTVAQIGTTFARLRGWLSEFPPGLDIGKLDLFFRYKLKSSTEAGLTTPVQKLDKVGIFEAQLTGLQPDSEYIWSAVGVYEGKEVRGELKTFHTRPYYEHTPVVETLKAIPLGDSFFTMQGTLISLGALDSVTPSFEYRQTTVDPILIGFVPGGELDSVPSDFQANTSGVSTTRYAEFRARVSYSDPTGEEVFVYGEWKPLAEPIIVTGSAEYVGGGDQAEVLGVITELGSVESGEVFFRYKGGDSPAWLEEPVAEARAILPDDEGHRHFSARLENLSLDTLYYYQAGLRYDCGGAEPCELFGDLMSIPRGFEVATLNAESLSAGKLIITGEILTMGAYSEAYVLVEYRLKGDLSWERVVLPDVVGEEGFFSRDITGLQGGGIYECRAGGFPMVEGEFTSAFLGETIEVEVAAFTDPDVEALPYEVIEGSQPGTYNAVILWGKVTGMQDAELIDLFYEMKVNEGPYEELGKTSPAQALAAPTTVKYNEVVSAHPPGTELRFRLRAEAAFIDGQVSTLYRDVPDWIIIPDPGELPLPYPTNRVGGLFRREGFSGYDYNNPADVNRAKQAAISDFHAENAWFMVSSGTTSVVADISRRQQGASASIGVMYVWAKFTGAVHEGRTIDAIRVKAKVSSYGDSALSFIAQAGALQSPAISPPTADGFTPPGLVLASITLPPGAEGGEWAEEVKAFDHTISAGDVLWVHVAPGGGSSFPSTPSAPEDEYGVNTRYSAIAGVEVYVHFTDEG